MSKAVLVIGGGIAGIRAALDLAEAGVKVILVEKGPSIGGKMAFLDKTFPTLDCSICIEGPLIGEVIRNKNIEVLTLSEVIGLEGEPGEYRVKILQRPRYVTEDCTKCGDCTEVCPVSVPFEGDGGQGLSLRKAIYIPYPQAEPGQYVIDIESCLNDPPGYFPCDRCVRVCERDAIDFSMAPKIIEREVASIIISTGYEIMDPGRITRYKFGEIPDVVTSYEFDRMLNASGPSGGEVLRPSDHKHAEKILFISCVGSRDVRYYEYCSGFCCMYILKHALQAKQHGVHDVTCLFMDIRAYGKMFEDFYWRAQKEGIKIVKGRTSEVEYRDGRIHVKYENTSTGEVIEDDFDMVVLAPAVLPSKGINKLAKILGLEVDEYGFIKTRMDDPVATSKPGIYVCGSASGPKDICDSVQEAGAAAIKALTHIPEIEYKEEEFEERIKEVKPERIGVFVCHCGTNIAGVVNIKKVMERVKKEPGVVHVEDLKFACSAASVEYIANLIREKKLNRLVVSACSPATHLEVFKTAAKMAGLNPYLVEMGNIRNLDSWVHADKPDEATEKAIDYTLAAIERSRGLTPLKPIRTEVIKRVLVVGGGVSGLVASSAVAKAGIDVILVEKEGELGGIVKRLHRISPYEISGEELVKRLVEEARESGVKIKLNTVVKEVSGFAGQFKVSLSDGSTVDVGAIILATGVKPHEPAEWRLQGNGKITTNLELEQSRYEIDGDNIVFISCIGSRSNGRGCSRYCCTSMISQALELRRKGKNVAVIYKDIRTYEREAEKLYREALNEGVLFLRVNPDKPMEEQVRVNGGYIEIYDELLSTNVEIPYDKAVLVLALDPNEDVREIAEALKVPLDREGFLMEAHPKLGPAESTVPGIFLAGSAQGPKMVLESMSHALAAASKAVSMLSKGYIEREPLIASIDQDICIKCGACMKVCTYGAIKGEVKKHIYVIPALCEGCGNCLAACPVGAIKIPGFTDEDIYRMMESILKDEPEKKPIAFTCYWCSYAAADNTGIFKIQYPTSPRLIRLPCSSRVSWRLVKKAFMLGAPAVAITGCRITESGSDCHYQWANKYTLIRYRSMKRIIEKLGIRGERLILELFGAPEVDKFVNTMKKLDEIAKTVSKEEIEMTIEKLGKVK